MALNLISSAFWAGAPAVAPAESTLDETHRSRIWVRIAVAAILLLALSLLWYWRSSAATYGDVIEVPAGSYLVSNELGALVRTPLDPFVIDRTEVTLEAFAKCVAAGLCAPPLAEANASLDDSALSNHPVAGITWDEAQSYCAGRRDAPAQRGRMGGCSRLCAGHEPSMALPVGRDVAIRPRSRRRREWVLSHFPCGQQIARRR